MKTWRWMMVMLSVGALAAACTVESNPPSDNDDDSGSGGNGGAATVSSSSSSSSSVSSTSSTPEMCDDGTAGQFDFANPACGACAQCAINGACMAQASECPAWLGQPPQGTDCDIFVDCIGTCSMGCDGDPDPDGCFSTCIGSDVTPAPAGTCIGDNQAGSDAYIGMLSCIVCQQCPNNCDAASVCM